MATGVDELCPDETAFLQKLRVALATTIIRNKPVRCSAKEYAQQIAQKLHNKESDWREKAKKLEETLLQTKQELIIARLRSTITHFRQQEGPQNLTSGDNEADDKTQCSEAFTEVTVLTPPQSSSEDTSTIDSSLEQTLCRNSQFLYSISILNNVTSVWTKCSNDDFKDVTVQSIKSSINHIKKYLHHYFEKDKLGRATVESVDALVKVLDSLHAESMREELVNELTALVAELLCCVNKDYNKKMDAVSTIIEKFGHSKHLRIPLLKLLLIQIQNTASHLRAVTTQGLSLNAAFFESCFFIVRTMDRLLNIHENDSEPIDLLLEEQFREELMDGLEGSLLHISEQFPLFAHYIWKVMGMLEWLDTSHTVEIGC